MAKKKRQNKLEAIWLRFAYKHTVSAIIAISVFILLLDTAIVQALLTRITDLHYLGMFLAGMLFVSFFTVAPAVVILLAFAQEYNPFIVAAVAGTGAMVGDLIILRFAEDKIAKELHPAAKRLKLISFLNALHKKRLRPVTATVGAIIIASPLPDEAGLALIGLSHIKMYQIVVVTLLLNMAGILALVLSLR